MEKYNFWKYADNPEDKCTCLHSTVNVPLHSHEDFYEFIIITCGGYYNINGKEEKLYKKNTLLMFHSGTTHSMNIAEPNSAHFTFLVSEDFFETAIQNYQYDVKSFLREPFAAVSLTYTQANYLTSLSNAMINMSYKSKQHIHQIFLHNIFYLIFSANQSKIAYNDDDYIETLIERLNNFQYVNDEISTIYMDYPISQCTLCAMFKKRMGTTIVHYRNIKRMEYAAQLLTNWNYSVTDVANRISISCLSYFSKEFKKQFGMTPKEYQKHHRKPYPLLTQPDTTTNKKS